jgi:hypothetical protein
VSSFCLQHDHALDGVYSAQRRANVPPGVLEAPRRQR